MSPAKRDNGARSLEYQLHTDQDLFNRAYAYIVQYY